MTHTGLYGTYGSVWYIRRFSVSPHNMRRSAFKCGGSVFKHGVFPFHHIMRREKIPYTVRIYSLQHGTSEGRVHSTYGPFLPHLFFFAKKILYPSPYVMLRQEAEITCDITDLLPVVVIAAAVTMGRGYILTVKREFYDRLHPLSFYTETKFVQRYRLSKAVVRILIKQYVGTKKKKILRGKHAIPHSLMVNISYPPTALTCTLCSPSLTSI